MEWIDVLVLVVTFAGLLALGMPIAYSIGLAAVATMLVDFPVGLALNTTAQRMAAGLASPPRRLVA